MFFKKIQNGAEKIPNDAILFNFITKTIHDNWKDPEICSETEKHCWLNKFILNAI
jgi:hypothetical protein